jgi:putative transposase
MTGFATMAPATVHHDRAPETHAQRARVLAAAYARTPERFVRRAPTPLPVPIAAWINKPDTDQAAH